MCRLHQDRRPPRAALFTKISWHALLRTNRAYISGGLEDWRAGSWRGMILADQHMKRRVVHSMPCFTSTLGSLFAIVGSNRCSKLTPPRFSTGDLGEKVPCQRLVFLKYTSNCRHGYCSYINPSSHICILLFCRDKGTVGWVYCSLGLLVEFFFNSLGRERCKHGPDGFDFVIGYVC